MSPLIIIQARLGSTRLPGKVLMPIRGKPMLEYLCERVRGRRALVAYAGPGLLPHLPTSEKTYWHDGPENDVAGRFAAVLNFHTDGMYPPYPAFIRLCGDSPLMDPALIDAAIALYEPPYLEIVSPVGCIEVCDTAAFLKDVPSMSAHEREHVTLRLRSLGRTIKVGGGPRLVVDTAADFERVKNVIEKMTRPHTEYNWRDCVALIGG